PRHRGQPQAGFDEPTPLDLVQEHGRNEVRLDDGTGQSVRASRLGAQVDQMGVPRCRREQGEVDGAEVPDDVEAGHDRPRSAYVSTWVATRPASSNTSRWTVTSR